MKSEIKLINFIESKEKLTFFHLPAIPKHFMQFKVNSDEQLVDWFNDLVICDMLASFQIQEKKS